MPISFITNEDVMTKKSKVEPLFHVNGEPTATTLKAVEQLSTPGQYEEMTAAEFFEYACKRSSTFERKWRKMFEQAGFIEKKAVSDDTHARYKEYTMSELQALAKQGDAAAQCRLGLMYEKGQSVPKNYKKAVEWYRKAAEQGYARAQHNLGWMHWEGRGARLSYRKAIEWHRKAAYQGYDAAQGRLGFLYKHGYGVPQDIRKTVKWYRKAADQGYAAGQAALGQMYEKGHGVAQDSTAAINWYGKAATQGYAPAQERLATMRRLAQVEAEALAWSHKAADRRRSPI